MIAGVRTGRVLQRLGCRSATGSNSEYDSPLRRLVKEARVGGEAVASDSELQWATEPYAADGRRRPEPRAAGDGTVLLFPGQGAHYVGMGRRAADIPAAKDVYDEASEVLGWDVWEVCTAGPAERLEEHVQPALLATSLAALAAAREERPAAVSRAVAAAGFSLGEWAALVWAGALSLPAALRAVSARGRGMAAAAAARPGGLLAAWLAPDAALPAALRAASSAGPPDAHCVVANYLYPGCRVLAGDLQCLQWLEAHGAQFGIKRTSRVAAAGAWHSPLVAAAREHVARALAAEDVAAPRRRVVSCVDARPYCRAADVRRKLEAHVAAPVRWEQTLQALYTRPREAAQPLTLLLAPGHHTRHTLRRVNARAWDHAVLVDL